MYSMYDGKLVFSQVMDFIPYHAFRHCVKRYDGEHEVSIRSDAPNRVSAQQSRHPRLRASLYGHGARTADTGRDKPCAETGNQHGVAPEQLKLVSFHIALKGTSICPEFLGLSKAE